MPSAYKTIVARLRRNGISINNSKKPKLLNVEFIDAEVVADKDLIPSEDRRWLKTHQTPFATLETKWKASIDERCLYIKKYTKNIDTILCEWPAYKIPEGPRLVNK